MVTYAFTDLHGRYDLWRQIRDFCQKDDILYFLGDACDRGPDGIKIIQELLNDKRVTYLKGNHEDMLIRSYVGKDTQAYLRNWEENGGWATRKALESLPAAERISLISTLYQLPAFASYTNKFGDVIWLCHAGCTPSSKVDINDETRLLWDRQHFIFDAKRENKYENIYCVHGHTPTGYLAYFRYVPDTQSADIDKVLFYDSNKKIDLDLMSFETYTAALLNLDTFEVKYFIEQEEKNNNEFTTTRTF